MIECKNCESPHYLQITQSRLRFEDEASPPTEVYEAYECTICGATGEFEGHADADDPEITGDIRFTGGQNQEGLLWP